MMNKIKLVVIGVLVVVLSGCFPVFVPGDGGRGGGGHDRGGPGDHGGDRGGHR